MGAEDILLRVEVGLCIAMLMVGAVTALASANAMKRLAGVLIAQIAATLAAGLLVGGHVLIVAVALIGATLIVGAALIVRLQERYGGVEVSDLNAADADSEPVESGPT